MRVSLKKTSFVTALTVAILGCDPNVVDPLSTITPLDQSANQFSIEQVNFDFAAGRVVDSDWGRVKVESGLTGYVNVFLEDNTTAAPQYHWVIDNMYVPEQESGPNAVRSSSETEAGPQLLPMTRYFDLRPNEVGNGPLSIVRAVVVTSTLPLPDSEEAMRVATQHPALAFTVEPTIINAEGDDGADEDVPTAATGATAAATGLAIQQVGFPPAPLTPVPGNNDKFATMISVFQSTWPNVETAKNQCVPMAHANTLRYLETQFNTSPMEWDLPQVAARGIGRYVPNPEGLALYEAVPEMSIVAQVDQRTKRVGVNDFESGKGSTHCQSMRGVFAYLHEEAGDEARAVFRHQGSVPFFGIGDGVCGDYPLEDIGANNSTREGVVPTWQWIYDQLVADRGVVMSYGRYNSEGKRTGGHMLRVYGAAKINGKDYLYVLDDGNQGDNSVGTRLQTFQVADTENSGAAGKGKTNDMLNIDGQSWEIEFALSTEALFNVFIP